VSTLAYFRARPDYGMARAFMLAFAVHAVLLAVMFFGVRMQNRPGDTVTVELWEAPPPPPPPVVEAPKPPPKPPPPKVEVPKPEPEPEVKKPEIVEKAPPPKPKPKPKPEAKPAPPRDDLEKLLMREQVAMEQRKLDEERRRADEARRKADSERTARELATAGRSRAIAQWTDKISTKIRGNIVRPQDITGNPEAIFDVAILPTGEILSVRKRKSSGHAGYDEAVERAIYKSSPLPLPDQPNLFQRNLELKFRPFDQ
jgi:colicin import membrane protein